jgi:hypothetical protein
VHAPPPTRCNAGWHRKLAHIFSSVDASTAYYRSNFGIDRDNKNTYYLDEENQFSTEAAVNREYGGAESLAEFKNLSYDKLQPVGDAGFITAEFQSIHRLPRTHALVFTLHKYFCPLSALKSSPESAAMMLRVIQQSPADKQVYTLGEDPQWKAALINFLDQMADGM